MFNTNLFNWKSAVILIKHKYNFSQYLTVRDVCIFYLLCCLGFSEQSPEQIPVPALTEINYWILNPDLALTYGTQKKKELGSILIEAKVRWLRIQNGADQTTFDCKKSYNSKQITINVISRYLMLN